MENQFELILCKLADIEESLKGLSSHNASREKQGKTHPEFLNIAQASDYLHIAKQTIYGLAASRKIPHYKTGKRISFKRSELMEWILKNRVKAIGEIKVEAHNYILNNRRNGKRRRI